jgi:L-iditol 2-dehydrogenase
MGHESAGVIAQVGPQVMGWRVGDRVTFDSTVYCGKCYHCRRGEINLCDHRRVLGVSCDDYRQHGAFAEYVAVPQHILYSLPEGLTFEQAALVEPVSIAVHAVERTPVALNDTAVVVGTGMIGLLIVQVLKHAGCGQIIAIDRDQDRLNLAVTLGADVVLNPDQSEVVAQVQQLTGNRGAALAFEVVGIAPTVDLATRVLRKGGALTLVGNLSPRVEMLLQAVVTRELTFYGSCSSRGEYPACLALITRGAVNVNALTSAVAPLAEGAAWFKACTNASRG